jgi:hypothetical protein
MVFLSDFFPIIIFFDLKNKKKKIKKFGKYPKKQKIP